MRGAHQIGHQIGLRLRPLGELGTERGARMFAQRARQRVCGRTSPERQLHIWRKGAEPLKRTQRVLQGGSRRQPKPKKVSRVRRDARVASRDTLGAVLAAGVYAGLPSPQRRQSSVAAQRAVEQTVGAARAAEARATAAATVGELAGRDAQAGVTEVSGARSCRHGPRHQR